MGENIHETEAEKNVPKVKAKVERNPVATFDNEESVDDDFVSAYEADDNDEWTEFAEYVLEGSRDEVDAVLVMLEQIAAVTENDEAFGGELGEIE